MKWSNDSPLKMVFCEKMRMYLMDNMIPQEPIVVNGYICDYRDLVVTMANLDSIRKDPDKDLNLERDVMEYPSKNLQQVQEIIEEQQDFEQAYKMIMKDPHQKLWEFLAEKALDSLNFKYAEKAFSLC